MTRPTYPESPVAPSVSAETLAVERALTVIEQIPDEVIADGDAAVAKYLAKKNVAIPQTAATKSIWGVVKCTAAIAVAIGSTVFVAAKPAKIKKLIKAAGGVKKTAQRVMNAFKKKGSLSAKAKAGFGDLGSGMVAAAVLLLDIDTIKSNCS